MFPLFNLDGGNKISLRWNIPFSHAVCSLANSSLLVWQNSDGDFLKVDKFRHKHAFYAIPCPQVTYAGLMFCQSIREQHMRACFAQQLNCGFEL